MKKYAVFIIIAIVVLACLFFIPTKNNMSGNDLWKNATYTQDTEFGMGEKTLFVKVIASEKSVTFTINTNKKTVGEALVEHNLISGDNGQYGLYVKVVNGIKADYDIDKSYWAFTKNNESMTSGVDKAEFLDGEHYELVYTK